MAACTSNLAPEGEHDTLPTCGIVARKRMRQFLSTHTSNHATSRPRSVEGTLVISLDFELYWGWRDRVCLSELEPRLDGARAIIPRLLSLFDTYQLHVTWATVGLLFLDGRAEALARVPVELPLYDDVNLSPYRHLPSTGPDEASDPYHYARSLIARIQATPHQELASHTFSHLYCLERGVSVTAFRADLAAAMRASELAGVTPRSITFPRNQVQRAYLPICEEFDLLAYRGTANAWPYRPVSGAGKNPLRRAARLLDSYLNVTGRHTFSVVRSEGSCLVNVPASRYLRPYSRRFRYLEPLKLRRVMNDMTAAARHGQVYHLWWHPEDLGVNGDASLSQVRRLADHFCSLQHSHGMRSMTMAEIAAEA